MNNSIKKINLLIIGNNLWCIDLANKLNIQNIYNIEYIYTYKAAIKRLRHNSYDLLLLQQDYFNYDSIELSKLSYAMSRPSIILCNSIFKLCIYQLWKYTSQWIKKFKIAKKLIHFKYIKSKNLNLYIKNVINKHDFIAEVTKQIQSR